MELTHNVIAEEEVMNDDYEEKTTEIIKYCYSLYKEKMDAWAGLFCPACKMPLISGEERHGQLITKCDGCSGIWRITKGEQDRYIKDAERSLNSFFK